MVEFVRIRKGASNTTMRVVAVASTAAALLGAGTWYFRQPGAPARVVDMPSALLLILALALTVSAACAGQWYIHHRFNYRDFVQHNEVGGFIIAVVGSLYAVLLGFLTLVSWQHYTDARQLIAGEAAATADAWHVALGLPAANRRRVRHDVLEYSTLMISNEWPQMREGGSDLRSGTVMMDAIEAAEGFKPADLGQSNAQLSTLQQLGVIHDDRQRRLADNRSGISWFEWLVLIIGASCVVCFCWLFGLANAKIHLLMTSAVAIVITSTLVLLFELQSPFRTSLGIDTADWTAVIDHIHWMQQSTQTSMHM